MSLPLKKSPHASLLHRPELGVDAVTPPRGDLDGDAALQGELDRILARKPVARPTSGILKSANSNRVDVSFADIAGDGFTWEPDIELDDEAQAAAAEKVTASAASAAWLNKARSDKRSKSRRNAAAWVATILIGSTVLAGSAYLLTGWSLDLTKLRQVSENWSPIK